MRNKNKKKKNAQKKVDRQQQKKQTIGEEHDDQTKHFFKAIQQFKYQDIQSFEQFDMCQKVLNNGLDELELYLGYIQKQEYEKIPPPAQKV